MVDLTHFVEEDMFLEGTGSIVFDHICKIAFACRSNRTNINLLRHVCNKLKYKSVEFEAVDEDGISIYHTNVMMWIGTKVAAICSEAIPNSEVYLFYLEGLLLIKLYFAKLYVV